MAEMRHEWNKMQAERTRERIARDTIKHRDRRIRELESEIQRLYEAINDALADLTPGYSPYSVLKDIVDGRWLEGK